LLFSKISGLCLAKPKNHKMLAIWAQQPTVRAPALQLQYQAFIGELSFSSLEYLIKEL
jgi:hypothetical protein